jgi:hypothetical protein
MKWLLMLLIKDTKILCKVMASDSRGITFIDFLEKDQTINSDYNIALVERLNDEIKKNSPI